MDLILNEDFYTHKELNPVLFEDNKLKPDIREALLKIADTFVNEVKENEVPLNVCDYWIVGSNAAYNYGPDSDIDVHIIVNMDSVEVNQQILTILYNYAKSSFNKDHDIKIKDHEVEVYIEDMNTTSISDGIYSIKQDRWIKVPQPKEENILDIKEEPEYREWEDKYRSLVLTDTNEINKFIDELYQMRKESLAKDGEFGIGNLIFKEFRNMGRLDDLKDQIKKIESKELTVEQLNESADNEDYYRFTIKNEHGRDMGSFFRVIDKILTPYYDETSPLYDINYDMYEIELDTPIPPDDKITRNTQFAYKKSFVDKHKEEFEDLETNLKEIGYGLITNKFKRPDNIVYEDDVQIAYISKDESIKLREKQERTVYNALNAWENYRLKYGKLDSFFELKYNFHLTDEEILWVINKVFEKGLIDNYTKDSAINYLKLQEQLSKRNKFKTSINEALKRNLNESTSNIFDVNHINIPFYNDMLKSSEARKRENREMEIVQMSPKEYFKECAKIFNSTFDSQIRQIKTDDETLNYIKSEIEKGNKLPLTWLDYDADRSQDGRHRMYVLGELFGWDKKYPVAVFTTADEKEAERREKEKEVARISKCFYWIEKKLFGYSYRNLDELKEEIEYLISDYLDDVKVEITQVGNKLLIDVNDVELNYNIDDFDWVKEDENRLELDPDDFDVDDIELDIL